MRLVLVMVLLLLGLVGCPRFPEAGTSCYSIRVGDTVYTFCN